MNRKIQFLQGISPFCRAAAVLVRKSLGNCPELASNGGITDMNGYNILTVCSSNFSFYCFIVEQFLKLN